MLFVLQAGCNGGCMTEKDANLAILKELFSLIKALEKDDASEDIIEQLKDIYNYFSFYVKA